MHQRNHFAAGLAFLIPASPASSFSLFTKPMSAPMADAPSAGKMDEYRGSNHWKGLIPSADEPRVWDEGFRSFLIKYGMFNHVVYDVFNKGEDGDGEKDPEKLRGKSRFGNKLQEFTKKGLEFSYVNQKGEKKQEYDFSKDYEIISNLVCSPSSVLEVEDNWFGFMSLSKDKKELVIVFRGTETQAEWVENATVFMEQLDGEPDEQGLALIMNRSTLMCHVGFQSLYREKADHFPSPKDQIYGIINGEIPFWKDGPTLDKTKLEKVTVVGHSLGGAMSQHCAIDLAHSKIAGDVPILGLAWAAPRIGNSALADWVKQQANLRILRVRIPIDSVTNVPPEWLWSIFSGGYKHVGTELALTNTHLHKEGKVKGDDGNSPNHNLEQYLHCIDPNRDVALMNKVGNVIPEKYCKENHISPQWHSQTFPRTLYHK